MAYCPAIRPSLTTGTDAAYVSTTAIWSSTRSLLRTLSAVTPAKVSAQSPPWSRNASPRETAASFSVSSSHSPANTSGGIVRSLLTAASTAAPVGVRRLLGRAERAQRIEVGDLAHQPSVRSRAPRLAPEPDAWRQPDIAG